MTPSPRLASIILLIAVGGLSCEDHHGGNDGVQSSSLRFTMHEARFGCVAAALPNGDVLVAGGRNGTGQAVASAEVFDASLLSNGVVFLDGRTDPQRSSLKIRTE